MSDSPSENEQEIDYTLVDLDEVTYDVALLENTMSVIFPLCHIPVCIFQHASSGEVRLVISDREIFAKQGNKRSRNGEYKIQWQCLDRHCKAKLNSTRDNKDINDDYNIRRSGLYIIDDDNIYHHLEGCKWNEIALIQKRYREEILARCETIGANLTESYNTVYASLLLQHPEAVNGFNNLDSLRPSMSARKSQMVPPLPTIPTLENFQFPEYFRNTLHIRSNPERTPQRFLMERILRVDPVTGEQYGCIGFGTNSPLRKLLMSREVLADGTFHVAPTPFEQLYSLHYFRSSNGIKRLFCGTITHVECSCERRLQN